MVKAKELIGKTIVSEESGRKFGVVGDVNFITESGELMNVVLSEPKALRGQQGKVADTIFCCKICRRLYNNIRKEHCLRSKC